MKSSQLLKILLADGWYIVRQKGSHAVMQHETKEGIIVFPIHSSKEVGTGLANKILKDAGLK